MFNDFKMNGIENEFGQMRDYINNKVCRQGKLNFSPHHYLSKCLKKYFKI